MFLIPRFAQPLKITLSCLGLTFKAADVRESVDKRSCVDLLASAFMPRLLFVTLASQRQAMLRVLLNWLNNWPQQD